MIYDNLSPSDEATIVACLALGAMTYADPEPCFNAIRALCPDVSWSAWEASVTAHRQHSRDLQSPVGDVDGDDLVVRDPQAWAAVAAEGRRYAVPEL